MAYGSMYNFSISDFIYDVNVELLIFAATFLIFTALVRFALAKRIMKDNKASASIIAICVGLMASYGLLKTGISLRFLGSINLGPEFLVHWLPWLILILAATMIAKWGLGILLMIFGAILAIAGFADLIYARGFGATGGTIIFLIGLKLYLMRKKRRLYKGMNLKDRESYKAGRRANRDYTNQKWNNAGYKTGKKIGSWIYGKKKTPPIQNKIQRTQRIRANSELQNKYDNYRNDVKRIMRNNKGKIPKLGTAEGHKRHRDIQAMKAIENLARKKGYRLR